MAKTSTLNRNERRRRLSAQYAEKRAELVAQIKHPSTTDAERDLAYLKLAKLGANTSKVRVRNRCQLTGRSRGNYRKFGICRNAFRQLALLGEIPGVRKASW